MKRIIMGLLSGILFLTACGQSAPTTQTGPQPDHPPSTSSPLPTATATRTALPSATPTASITPLPTIPTFTPTFDVSTIVTVTSAPQAECPIAKPAENLNFNFLNLIPGIDIENRDHAEENILNFLDTYGAEPLIKYLRSEWTNEWRYEGQNFLYKDLTSDGTPELVLGLTSFYIFSCTDGRYKKIFELPPDGHVIAPQILFSKDNNRNGLIELTILIGTWTGGGRAYQIYEWDGEQFRNLVLSDNPNFPDLAEIWVEASGKIFYQDMNNDTVNELIRDSGIMSWLTYSDALPWRNKRTYYQWNGKNYAPTHHEFTIPEFRYQAIQDGDLALSQSEFTKALSLYQDAIFSDKLKYYSVDIRENLQINWIRQFEMSQSGNISPTRHHILMILPNTLASLPMPTTAS